MALLFFLLPWSIVAVKVEKNTYGYLVCSWYYCDDMVYITYIDEMNVL